jgi:type IV pilus assembly protein PilE
MNRRTNPTAARSRGLAPVVQNVALAATVVVAFAAAEWSVYRAHVLHGHLTAGTQALAELRTRMEQYRADHHTYLTVDGRAVSPCDTTGAAGTFTLACPTLSPASYQLAATGSGPTAGFVYTTDSQGNRKTIRVADGWGRAAPDACWITREDDAC